MGRSESPGCWTARRNRNGSSKMVFAQRSHGKDIGPPKAWSPSDHFDGKRFFNPTLPKDFAPSRRSTLKMVREPRSRWPAWVENMGVPRLNEMLGANEVANPALCRDLDVAARAPT